MRLLSCQVTYLEGFRGAVTIWESSSISSDSSGSLVLTTISSKTASSPFSAGPGWGADDRPGVRGVRELVLLRRNEDTVATGKFGLPRTELRRRDNIVDGGDASTNESWWAVEPLLRLRVDLLGFPMPLFCPGRVPREFVPIMMYGTRLPLERGYREY